MEFLEISTSMVHYLDLIGLNLVVDDLTKPKFDEWHANVPSSCSFIDFSAQAYRRPSLHAAVKCYC